MTNKQARKAIVRAMIRKANERFLSLDYWDSEAHDIYLREVSRMYGLTLERVLSIGEYWASVE